MHLLIQRPGLSLHFKTKKMFPFIQCHRSTSVPTLSHPTMLPPPLLDLVGMKSSCKFEVEHENNNMI
jgi:hypothetical protein